MVPSLRLGRLFGIPLFLHGTFWLLPLWVVLTRSGAEGGTGRLATDLAVLATLFGCVVLHELGHALAARCYGIRTRDITLYPIGGVASLERMSEKPHEELVIAVAGPAVNVVIAVVLGLILFAANEVIPDDSSVLFLKGFLETLIYLNVGMILFNMIPAFPLDGGRVLRSLLSMGLGHIRATRLAVRIGTALAIGLPILVLVCWPEHAPPIVIMFAIALMLITAGQRELMVLEQREKWRRFQETYAEPTTEPPWTRPGVTVYVMDPGTGRWVPREPM